LVAPATKNIWALGRFGPLQIATLAEMGDETTSFEREGRFVMK
jgi:hypothetical protein